MPSQSMKAANCFLQTCLPKPSLPHQEDENPRSNLTSSSAESRRFFASTTATSFFPTTQFTNHESLPSLEDAFAQFMDSYPHYSESYQIDEIRGQEYNHLSLTNRVCLDYFGIGLFAFSQFHNEICWSPTAAASTSSPENQLQPNSVDSPLFSMLHRSVNLKKELLNNNHHESNLESAIKKRIRDFLSINADDYCVVLTANRTAAFKLLAESYPFQSHRNLLSVYDHHSEAVEAMTSTSVKRGAKTMAAEFTWPRLRIKSTKLKTMLVSKTKKKKKGLFVFQLQSRVTGARYSYQWMQIAQENGWHVVLDACALGPKDMDSLGLSLLQPDFLVSSFYKVFGDDPTGFGCLFVKKTAVSILEDNKISGIASIIPANRFLHPVDEPTDSEMEDEHGTAAQQKQDQTQDISSNTWGSAVRDNGGCEIEPKKQVAIEFRCLDHVDSLGLTLINARGRYLTNWLINALTKLYHPNSEKNSRLVKLYGPKIKFDRGASLAFNVFDWKGGRIDPVLVQKLGDRKGITLGHGFLQNLRFEGKREAEKGRVLERRKEGSGELGLKVVTAALGYLVNFQDVYKLWAFAAQFLDADFVEKERWRFGVPHAIITYHGTQFDSAKVRELCLNMGISLRFSSVCHPQSNGQVENVNKTILKDLKTRLKGAQGRWAELLPLVLWTYRTTARRATGDTPFALVYGADAVIPVETLVPSARVFDFDKDANEEMLRAELYIREERREVAALKAWEYKRRIARYHDKKVRARELEVGDLVLRRSDKGGKLDPMWEGPFKIMQEIGQGAFKLQDMDDRVLPKSWNLQRLKRYFP